MPQDMSDTSDFSGDEDLNPHYGWDRAIPAPGHSAVDFEQRVDFARLHKYRLARAQEALANSDLGAILCFDNNNIRYLTSTVIGEWSRDKVARYAMLMGGQDPHLWDFGSAAAHHRLYAPWLPSDNCHAGMLGLRGTVPPAAGLMDSAAKEIKQMLVDNGMADHAARRRYLRAADDAGAPGRRHRCARCTAGHAGRARDQKHRRDCPAQPGGRDGRRRLSHDRRRAETGRARKRHRREGQRDALRNGLRRRRGDQRDLGRTLQPASA